MIVVFYGVRCCLGKHDSHFKAIRYTLFSSFLYSSKSQLLWRKDATNTQNFQLVVHDYIGIGFHVTGTYPQFCPMIAHSRISEPDNISIGPVQTCNEHHQDSTDYASWYSQITLARPSNHAPSLCKPSTTLRALRWSSACPNLDSSKYVIWLFSFRWETGVG